MAHSFWIEENGKPAIRTHPLGQPDEGEVRFHGHFSLISQGTERRIALGMVPPQIYPKMKVPYMEGDFDLPIKYGYSLVGSYQLDPQETESIRGQLMHPHQDMCIVREDDINIIPSNVSSMRATLVSNMETAINAIWDSNVSLGDRVVVVGFGLIGSLIARVLSLYPAIELLVADIRSPKLKLARDMGLVAIHPQELGEDLYDLAYHCSATGDGLQTAIDSVGFEGNVVDVSWYGKEDVVLQLGGTFHTQRKKIISSQVSTMPVKQRTTWSHQRRLALVFELLSREIFDEHITEVIAFHDLPDFFETTILKDSPGLGYVVDYTRD